MNLLDKIENAINKLLFLLGSLVVSFLKKILPKPFIRGFFYLKIKFQRSLRFLKLLPKRFLQWILEGFQNQKSHLLTFNYKEKIKETYTQALEQYKEKNQSAKTSKLKTIFMTPFLIIGQWLKGLSPGQSLMLLSFTAASFLAAVNMIFSGQRLIDHHMGRSRAPASVEEEILYERPAYYKGQTRHFDFTSLRLPVYFANVNELKSVDVDFTAILSNRMSRMQLEKLEFQLRDHFILEVEPVVASFPLEEEGREIIRQKLLTEVNRFIQSRKIEGEAIDLEITYVLAN